MPRPRKSTLDAFLDQFSDWSAEDQEAALDLCALIHRQTKRRKPEPAEPVQTLVQGVGLDAAGGKTA